jgi:hypothetical protein
MGGLLIKGDEERGVEGLWQEFECGEESFLQQFALHIHHEYLLINIYRIQTWALEEARRRLEAEGILKEPEDKS